MALFDAKALAEINSATPAGAPGAPAAGGDVVSLIHRAAQAEGVGEYAPLLVALAKTESDLNPLAQNPGSTAGGLFQFIDDTARRYGITDKFDAEQSAAAAARMFRDNLKRFGGDARLALAAHHVGPGKAEQALRDASIGDADVSTQEWLRRIERRAGRPAAGGTAQAERAETPWASAPDLQSPGFDEARAAAKRQTEADESPVSTSFARGWEALTHNAGLFVDNAVGDAEGVAERIARKRAWDEQNPAPSSSQAFMERFQALDDDDFMGVLGAAIQNPTGALNQMVEQTPNSLPGLALQIPTALATGALFATGWGAPIAIALQGAAAFVGNVLPEGGAVIEERFAKSGIDPNDVDAVTQWATANRGELLQAGATKAGVISITDGVAGYLGGKLIAGPSARFAKLDRDFVRAAGVDPTDTAAVAKVRATPAYKQAVQPAAADLLSATTGAQKVARALGGMGFETAGEGVGEYAGSYAAHGEASLKEAALEGMMGGGTSAAMTGANAALGALQGPDLKRAQLEALAKPIPNAPLTTASNIAAVAGAAPGAAPNTAGEAGSMGATGGADATPADPLAERLAKVASFVEDKTFLRTLRDAEGYGKESANEALRAFVVARNPNTDPMMRERALTELEQFIDTFVRRPNFTMGAQSAPAGTDLAPAQQQAGAAPQLEAPAFAERDVTPQAPAAQIGVDKPLLESPAAVQTKRDEQAAYEQAFQDMLKAEELGNADADLMEFGLAQRELQAQHEQLKEAVREPDARVAAGREQQTVAARRAVLDAVLADPETANPTERFRAELSRQGFLDSSPTADEAATLARFEDARAALAPAVESADATADTAEPSAPNELNPYVAPALSVPTVKTASPESAALTAVFDLLDRGWKLVGKTLQSPTGKRRILNARELEAVRSSIAAERSHGDDVAEVADPATASNGGKADPALTARARPYADDLRAMAQDAGWAERGGMLLRDTDGNVTGRTAWIPRAEWFVAGMQDSPDKLAAAIESVLAGGAAYKKDRRTIEGMIEWLDQQNGVGEIDPAAPAYDVAVAAAGQSEATMDTLDVFDTLHEEMDEADAMRALGFTEQEIANATIGSQGTRASAGTGREDDAARAGADGRGDSPAAGTQAGAGAESGEVAADLLSSYSNDDIARDEAARREQAEADARAQKQADDRAKADAERDSFTLTGSNRPADVMAAQGQGGLFDAPPVSAATPPANSPANERPADADWFGELWSQAQDLGKEADARKAVIADALAAVKAQAEQTIAEWSAKQYKANSTQVELHGDGPRKNPSMDIGAINDGRREKVIAAAKEEAAVADRLRQSLDDAGGFDRLADLLRETMAEAERAVASGMTIIPAKSAGDYFEYLILDRLGIRPERGAYTSNAISKALRATIASRPSDAGVAAIHEAVAKAETATDTNPTDGQKEAGNYAKGKVDLHGQRISIETPKGAERSGIGADGKRWSVTMPASYGYFLGTEANDGDHVDVFVGPKPEAGLLWVVNQVKPDSTSYDEPKVMLGYDSAEAARADYLLSFSGDFGGRVFGEMVGPFSVAELAKLLPTMRRAAPVKGDVAIEGAFQRASAAPAMHENATAPEHVKVETGVTVEELRQIAAAFREHIDSGGDAAVTHVFDAPAKGDIVNLEKKAGVTAQNVGGKRVYHREAGWLTPEEAKAKVAEWKERARAQYDDPKSRSANSDKVVLSLFDLSGEWSKPWEEAGYNVFRFDIQDDPKLGDVNNFSVEFFNDWFSDFDGMDVYAILAATPCTDFASSGSRHFAAKDADGRTVSSVRLVKKTLAAIEYFKPAVWALENPVGRIESLTGLPPWRLSFDPYHLGDTYTKKTLIWGRFNGDLPVAPVDPVEGSKMHTQYGGKSQATKNARSVTPEGFAYAFFDANNAIDHPAMALANKFDRLDRDLIAQAIDAGVTPDEIESAVEDFYYMELDDEAANDAIRTLLPTGDGPGKGSSSERADGEQWVTPQQLDLPLVEHDGDKWYVLSTGVRRDDGKVMAHLSSATRGRQAANGVQPVQMQDYIDLPASAVAEPKNWRTSYGAAQKYAEALGVNPRGDNGKYLKLPALVAAIEAKRGEAPAAEAKGAEPAVTVEPQSLDEMRVALEAGHKVHYDYAGTYGRTLWLEETPPNGWAVKSKDDDSNALFTSGGVGVGGAWSKEKATRRALEDAEFRFTKWKPLVEQADVKQPEASAEAATPKDGVVRVPPAVAAALTSAIEKQKARFTRLNAAVKQDGLTLDEMKAAMLKADAAAATLRQQRVKIFEAEDAAIAAIESGDASRFAEFEPLFGDAHAAIVSEIEARSVQSAPAQTDDLNAMFADILAEELAKDEAAKPQRAPKAQKSEPSEAARRMAAGLKVIRANDEGTFIVRDPADKGGQGTTIASFEIGASGRPVKVKHHYSFTTDAANLAIEQWMAANRPTAQPKAPRSAGKAAASAAKNTADGFANAIAGLGKLFGGHGRLSSGLTFDEDTYLRAKPLFRQAIQNFSDAAADVREVMRAVVRAVLDQFGPHVAGNMQPYIVRFVEDVRAGDIGYDENVTDQGEDHERRGTDVEGDAALDRVPAAKDRGSEGSGNVRVPRKAGGRAGDERDATADARGDEREGSRGNGAAGVHPAAAGAPGPVSAPNVPAENFRITEDVRLGQGGEVQKFNDNVAAIEILKRLAAERRRATPDEQRALARYVGWGGLAPAFRNLQTNAFNSGWEKRGAQLEALLTKRELASARSTTTDAHYTSQTIVQGMWGIAERLGFQGGTVLEPSVGVGNFLGLVPESLRGTAKFIGIEYDGLTAGIAKALYPQSSILQTGFEKVPLPADSVDLAIGNPPFGKTSLYFPAAPHLNGKSIHNQFFLGSMDAVRPGGLQMMVVSRYLLDAKDGSARRELAEQAELVAAIRLPDNAFRENARTEVVTDIIVLRKYTAEEQAERAEAAKGKPATAPDWVHTDEVADPLGGEPITVNRYFARRPEMILGTLERSGSMRHGNDVTVRAPDGVSLEAALARAIERLPRDVMVQRPGGVERSIAQFEAMRESLELTIGGFEEGNVVFDDEGTLSQVILTESGSDRDFLKRRPLTAASPWSPQLFMDNEGRWFRQVPKLDEQGNKVKNGKFVVYEREVFPREADVPEALRLGDKRFARLAALVSLRDTLKRQIVLETADEASNALETNRAALAAEYDAFVKEYGFVGDNANQALLGTMPDGPLVTALEMDYDAGVTPARAKTTGQKVRKPSATPAPIMSRRVVVPYTAPTKAGTAQEALTISLAEQGVVDLERMAELLGTDVEAVVRELHDERDAPLIFRDPETDRWEVRDAYLSGQVVRKLAAARDAGIDKNIAALEAVQPEPIPSSDIGVRIGSTWVPPDVYAQFIEHVTGAPAAVRFSKKLTTFDVDARGDTPKASVTWGTGRMKAGQIVATLLNSKAVAVYDTYTDANGNTRRELNEEQTQLALAKADEIINEFADWIMGDADRRQRLTRIYNEQFNNRVIRQYDGSHLTLPGKVPDTVIGLRRHQKNAVWRGIAERFLLIDHAVGAGKTFTAIARAMERRRTGLSQKPMIVVPNHMIEQFAADVYRLYPGARVLAMGQKDLEAQKRRRAFARIATGDWDIVIVPHSSFGFMGISPEREAMYLEAEIKEMEVAIKEAAQEDSGEGWRKPQSVKTGEAILKGLNARLQAIRDRKRDNLLTFEQLGVDDMTIDEAHEFKNLMYYTRLTKVLGLGSQQGSKKAYDLYNKVRALRDSPKGSVVFMTGTPISNSVVEMYTLMKYLSMDELIDYGIENFDAWHKQFAEAVTKFEMNDVGRLTEKTRLSRWSNMPELMKLYYGFTDAVSLDDIKRWYKEDHGKDFPVPKVKGGGRRNLVVKPTAAQLAILQEVIAGFDGLEDIDDVQERNAERLRLMNRARNVALDARVADPRSTSDEKGGKLDTVAGEVARIYHDWTADKGAQLVFLDRSVPKSNGDKKVIEAYDGLQAKLAEAVALGNQDRVMELSDDLAKYDAAEIEQLRIAQTGGWNAYQQIKDNLVARGIPAEQIRFIQEANTDDQKQQLFDMVKSGEVRVLIGSTPKMGAGTNVQDRLVALHHVDVNWKPSDIEQREGRIVRQGNLLLEKYGDEFEVELLAYATERTYDAKMWALNEAKGRFINSLRAYTGEREIEVEDQESENMAEMAALASGDPRMLERVQLDAEVKKLEMLRRSHNRRQGALDDAIADAKRTIAQTPAKIDAARADDRTIRTAIEAAEADLAARTVVVEGETYTSHNAAMAAADKAIEDMKGGNERARFTLMVGDKPLTSKDAVGNAIREAFGDVEPLPLELADGTTFKRLQAASVTLSQLVNTALVDGDESIELGTLRGLPLKAYVGRMGDGVPEASLYVEGRYVREAVDVVPTKETGTFSPTALATALSRLNRGIGHGNSARYLESRLKSAEADLPALEEQAGKPFPKQAEFEAKKARLEELTAILSAEGASGVEAAAPADAETAPSVLRAAAGNGVDFHPLGLDVAAGVLARVRPTAEKVWNVELRLVPTFAALPQDAQDAVTKDYDPSESPKGMLHQGVVYLIADAHDSAADLETTILHEVKGHVATRRFYGDDIARELNKLFLQIGGNAGMQRIAEARDIRGLGLAALGLANSDYSNDVRVQVLMEELLSHIAQEPRFMDRVKAIVGLLRALLRRSGLVELAEYGETDLLHVLRQAERNLSRPGPGPDGGPRGGVSPAVLRQGDGEAGASPAPVRFDVDRAWRDLISRNKFSDFDEAAEFEATRNDDAPISRGAISMPTSFTLSRMDGKQWVALHVEQTPEKEEVATLSASLEVGGDYPTGTGIATRMYLAALRVAQQTKSAWISEGVRSDQSVAIYERLKSAGVPFTEVGRASVISADALAGVDLQAVADRLAAVRRVERAPGALKGAGDMNPSIMASRGADRAEGAGLTADQFRAALVERFGEGSVASLEAQGLLNILDLNDPEVSEDPAADLDPSNPAWYNPNTGEAFFVPQFVSSAEDAVAQLLHEVGEHHGLQPMLGARGWEVLKARVAELAMTTKGDVAAAWAGVLDVYPEFRGAKYAEDPQAAIRDDRFMHEVIARIGESAAGRKSSLWRDILAAVNRFLLKHGFGRQINKNELADLVAGSLARVMRGKGRGAARTGGSAMNSIAPHRAVQNASLARVRRVVTAIAEGLPFSSEWIDFGRTPAVLRMLGAPDLPLKLDPKKLTDAVKPGKKHGLSADDVVAALEHIGDPVAVFDSRTQAGAQVVVTEVLSQARPMLIAVHLDSSGRVNAINKVASVYAKDGAQGFFDLNDAEENVRYLNNEKRQAFEQATGLQLPLGAPAQPGVDSNLMHEGDLVKFERDAGTMARRSFDLADYAGRAGEAVADALPKKVGDYLRHLFGGSSDKTFNWYHKTIGSQFHKAKVDPQHYGRVFNAAQGFIEDVARFGTESADRAPSLLPKMDTLAGAWRETKNFRRDKKDAEAIAAPIYEGTLYEENGEIVGRVWTDDELRGQFGLNDRQIDLYRQFRAAVDHSLEQLAVAEMTKVARAYANPKHPGELQLIPPSRALGMDELAEYYYAQFGNQLDDAKAKLAKVRAEIEASNALMLENAASVGAGRTQFHEIMKKKDAEDAAKVEALEQQVAELARLKDAFLGKRETIHKLQRDGYAPLMRFGKHTVDVVEMVDMIDEPTGEPVVDPDTGEIRQVERRHFFGMFETQREANEAAAVMREEYPQATVTTGIASQDGYQLFGSVSLDSLTALAALAGKEEDAFVQKFYKDAVAQRSALKRLIHRKGVEGYSTDVTRTLAAFVMSNARATASAYHFGDLMDAAIAIPKEKGDVKDEAVSLINYIRDPNEEAGMLRGLLFMHFLGGSIAAAAVNLTQSATTTAPFLHQFGVGVKDMAAAAVDAGRRMRGKDIPGASRALSEALGRAEAEGVVAPHNIHALMGQTGEQGLASNRVMRLFSHAWGVFFGMAEQYNREVAFIAAFRAAEKMGRAGLREAYAKAVELAQRRGLEAPDPATYADPFEFARDAVRQTQFVLSKAARPNWARGAVGATLFTFKQFMVNYLELAKRLPNRERALMLGTLIVLAGVGGLPGADDLDDLIDTIGQSLGYATNAKGWKQEAARAIFGEAGGEFVMDGVSAFIPLELGSRLGMGNLLPATGVFKPSNAGRRGDQAMEVLGAAGGYFKQLFDAADYLQRGRYTQGLIETAAPKAVRDIAKAVEMADTGVYDDTRGRRVVDVSTLDAFVKAIGFQPRAVSEVQKAKGVQMQDVALFKAVKANIAELLAQAIHERDAAKRQRALELLADWNEKNPEQRMQRPAAPAIARRVQAMRMSAADRMKKTTPRELRAMAEAE